MLFEWDDDKDRLNQQKHEMPLRAGIPAFDDLNAIEFEDNRIDYGEERYILIGLDNRTKLLYVVYTMREKGVTRLISVRKATKSERKLYESGGY
ncbi:BrnT family toxin [Microbulbifer sp. OS29]|uniref:BrnT family toxin n=1 Tax=Microbulbifer okhotskensis TaxID=2926617 RepID=A0A9X2EM41_9GAMM|nr:BrnT family toxin [Microbulbifer okhotskensis]MCO1334164.1 BrnT family toxin [Microbulbifer okhotskensis]